MRFLDYVSDSHALTGVILAVLILALLSFSAPSFGEEVVVESAREIPVAYSVDMVVVGGSTHAVAAAAAAAQHGTSVFLAAPRLYLGEDLCDSLRLRFPDGQKPTTDLAKRIFRPANFSSDASNDSQDPPNSAEDWATTPHRVKTTLDEMLVRSGVRYLYGCYATDVLVDADGTPSGIVMANRSGRQAVVAKIIIDATPQASVARMAGADQYPWATESIEFLRVTLQEGEAGEVLTRQDRLKLAMPDASFPRFADAEQMARDRTYEEGQLRASAFLHYIPPNPIVCRLSASEYQTGKGVDLGHFQPRNIANIFLLSGCADIPRAVAAGLLEPCGLVAIGERIGTQSAERAFSISSPKDVRVHTVPASVQGKGDVAEVLNGIRSTPRVNETVPSSRRGLPILGRYDVVVIGGGTSGAAAAIGAARKGARTLVAEFQEGLGGTGTLGLIGKPYHGRAAGFGGEVPFPNRNRNIEHKMEWYRKQLRAAKADIWFGVLGCGVVLHGSDVLGAVVATPQGRGVVLADTTIDATGNADLAVAAGADSMYGADAGKIAMQGAGLPVRGLQDFYVNTDYLLVDESDMQDVWRALIGARTTMPEDIFDSGSMIQTRERRRVVGDHVMTYIDQIAGRTYPDSIVYSGSDYDSHGYPSHPYFALIPHDEKSLKANHPAPGGTCYTSYRCLLPRGFDRMLVVGLGISMKRDAAAMVRMQRDISNQGYAAGVAAAMAAQENTTVRDIEVRVLQRHLVETGALPSKVLSHRDSFPLSSERVQQAVTNLAVASNPKMAGVPLAIVLSHRDTAIPMMRRAYHEGSREAKLVYAKVLGMLGETTGVETLIKALRAVLVWDAKILQGAMAEYAHLPTRVDSLILALGYSKDPRALEPILEKLSMLDAETTLSHHRAVALALEHLGDDRAAKPLAGLLQKPGMRGHVMRELEPLHNRNREKRRREGPLREIVLARALFRCGDHHGLGEEILREYLNDIRGLFAVHAQAVLEKGR